MSNLGESMPKLKTRKSAARRFKVTGSGKIVRRKAYKSHLLQHKSSARKRNLSKMALVSETQTDNVRLMLPYL
ncbi:50S ribosomal protein L35 [Planktothrix agardhii]|uniref:Large ribosomal subunit protein bL35 n=3 Tax=Planktothrix TaxID=54304 RepID=A0A1J1JCR6_PLAAG|nr:50S ribosomal subunit protein L35 [Planktothrix rubescens NIVA-CYA 18]CAD5923163.1 50S ribosomal protein L35 [Planktothrix agardhii]BBD56241.1 50S ribosomal protein L35 [Planktothrix agardhii NIES-204]CAD5943534.1 50S ribosomal protein L35 [Planktothrix agardhii]CAD5946207.1 50S ribosomal protein L35 [Planktothrix agardhii]